MEISKNDYYTGTITAYIADTDEWRVKYDDEDKLDDSFFGRNDIVHHISIYESDEEHWEGNDSAGDEVRERDDEMII